MRAAIAGAATGIGASTVELLKRDDHEVIAFDIIEPTGVDLWIPLDLSDTDSIDAAVASTTGTFDCLINNAGLPPRPGLAGKVLSVNFLGLRHFTNALLPRLNTGGAIVNTASRAGAAWRDNIEQVRALSALDYPDQLSSFITAHSIDDVRAYTLSKEAVIAYSIAQTSQLQARGLRMNSVSPAAVDTPILDDFAIAFGERMTRNLALTGRAGKPEEIAELILFLASQASHWIRGNDITIDGGMSAIAMSEALVLQAYSK